MINEFIRCGRRSFLKGSGATLLVLGSEFVESQFASAQIAKSEPFSTRPGEPTFVLESSTLEDLWRVRRKLNPLVKSPRNPIMIRDQEWETSGPIIHGTVLYDPEDKLFKCWYQIFSDEAYRERLPWSYRICYATSSDGYEWHKPDLGLVEWKGSKHNNYIKLGRQRTNAICVVIAPPGSGAPHRFLALYLDKPGVCLAYSDNGTEWIEHPLNPIEPSESDDHNILLYDQHRRVWMIYLRPRFYAGVWKRRRALMESLDLKTWTKQQTVLIPDEADPPEIMVMPVFQRGNLFWGLLDMYDQTRGSNEVELTFSRDGRNWVRVPPRERFIPRGPAGDFDSGTIFVGSQPVIVGDEMRFYYGAFDGDHERLYPSIDMAIGVGSVPVDRLYGVVHSTPEAPGFLLTRPLLFNGEKLEVNAMVGSQLRVAVLDWGGQAMPGFGFEDCQPIVGDSLRHSVSWRGQGLPHRGSNPLRLKFKLERATLYTFTVV